MAQAAHKNESQKILSQQQPLENFQLNPLLSKGWNIPLRICKTVRIQNFKNYLMVILKKSPHLILYSYKSKKQDLIGYAFSTLGTKTK